MITIIRRWFRQLIRWWTSADEVDKQIAHHDYDWPQGGRK